MLNVWPLLPDTCSGSSPDHRTAHLWCRVRVRAFADTPRFGVNIAQGPQRNQSFSCRKDQIRRGAMTFSIIARDDRTGRIGVAVASRFLAVGARNIFVR